MLYKSICLAGLVLAGLFLTGCAAFQTSTTQNLPVAAAEQPTADMALITVEGTPSFAGIYKLYAIEVYDNKTLVGKVGPHGKLVWLRTPGQMILTLKDSVYGADWCLGRIHTVAAGETYHFKIECNAALVYSIAGPGISIEDEQTGKFLTAWRQLRKGMSADEASILPGWHGRGELELKTSVGTFHNDAVNNPWYRFHYTLVFDNQGGLSEWKIKMNCPKCGKPVAEPVEPIRGSIMFYCPSCMYSFTPAGQE
jgi:hypothetical protein